MGYLPDVKICLAVEPDKNHRQPAFIGKKKTDNALADIQPLLKVAPVGQQIFGGGSRIEHFALHQHFGRVSGDRFRQNSSSDMPGFWFDARELDRRLQVRGGP